MGILAFPVSRSNWIFPPTESFQLESGKEVGRASLFTAQDYAPPNWSRHKDPKFWDSVHLYIDSVRERGETANGSKRRRTIKAESNKRSLAMAEVGLVFQQCKRRRSITIPHCNRNTHSNYCCSSMPSGIITGTKILQFKGVWFDG